MTLARPVRIAIIFVACYCALQGAWIAARGSALEKWIIENANVRTSVALIQMLSPDLNVTARAASIVPASGGGLNIRNGCEGTEILFPLLAGLLAYPFMWPIRVAGLLAGIAFVFALNQLRLLILFYSYRDDPALFGELHGFVTPLVLVLCVAAFFAALVQWDRRRCHANAH